MPGGDGTGPVGAGPMTGRSAGYCAGYPMPGFANSMQGMGFGMGRGRRRGRGRGMGRGMGRGWRGQWGPGFDMPAPVSPVAPGYQPAGDDQLQALKTQAEHLEGILGGLKARIDEMSKAGEGGAK